jgi:hypothetical protein
MKISAIAAGLLTSLIAVPASAGVEFSTVHTTVTPNSTRLEWPLTGTTGAVPRGGPIGESFFVPSATTISDAQLQLTANNPLDGGSVQVFIVPDTGTGGTGVAALPTFAGTGATLTMTGATQIGSIADSSLPSTTAGALETFPTSLAVGAGEYWLVAQNTIGTGGAASTAKWVFDTTSYTGGTGTTGQQMFWQAGPTGLGCDGSPCTFSDTSPGTFGTNNPGTLNLFEGQIDVPEPASLAILGVGLAALGVIRLRRSA